MRRNMAEKSIQTINQMCIRDRFKTFSKEMEYIKKNTTDHEGAQMSRANVVGTPNDKMTLRDIYDEIWELDARCDTEETIGTAHEKDDNNVEGMTEDDWER